MNTAQHFKKNTLPLLFILSLFIISSCEEKKVASKRTISINGTLIKEDAFAMKLQTFLQNVDTTDSVLLNLKKNNFSQLVSFIYKKIDYNPIWLSNGSVSEAAELFINELGELENDGMNPNKYGYDNLKSLLDKIKNDANDEMLALNFDTSCTYQYLKASKELLLGQFNPTKMDADWHHTNDTNWNAPELLLNQFAAKGDYPSLDSFRSKISSYTQLRTELIRFKTLANNDEFLTLLNSFKANNSDSNALSIIEKIISIPTQSSLDSTPVNAYKIGAYQYFSGLNPTGFLDEPTKSFLLHSPDTFMAKIKVNLERLRWMPQQLEAKNIFVNTAKMELSFFVNDSETFKMRTVVGKVGRPTPSLNANMLNIVFNPPWFVPPTIMKEDITNGLKRRGGSYLSRKGLVAYSHGRKVNVSQVNANNLKHYIIQQPPGVSNSLGVVKFNLPNPYDIYLHDTPHRGDFKNKYRANSSGCIRLHHPKEFAEYILRQVENDTAYSFENIDKIIQTRITKTQQLKDKIPVHIVYLTAQEDSLRKGITFFKDIYKRDTILLKALRYASY